MGWVLHGETAQALIFVYFIFYFRDFFKSGKMKSIMKTLLLDFFNKYLKGKDSQKIVIEAIPKLSFIPHITEHRVFYRRYAGLGSVLGYPHNENTHVNPYFFL